MSRLKNNLGRIMIHDPWPYWVGAVLLGILNTLLLMTTNQPWKITTGFVYWAAWVYQKMGGHPENWTYFNIPLHRDVVQSGFIDNYYIFQNLGIILGALMSVLLASQFKVKKIKDRKQVIAALLGGILMGYATRMTFGCNIGGLFSAIASMSLNGWIYALFMFIGTWIGSKILVKYLL